MRSMTIFDDRLIPADAGAGAMPPHIATQTLRVGPSTGLVSAFQQAKDYADCSVAGQINLNIMCHGFYSWAESDELQQTALVGGFGLQLCREGLTWTNLANFAPMLSGKVASMVIYACGAASSQANGAANGRGFCRDLAGWLNGIVYAADRMQVYNYSHEPNQVLDFGQWEGTVYRFTPDGNVSVAASYPSPNRT